MKLDRRQILKGLGLSAGALVYGAWRLTVVQPQALLTVLHQEIHWPIA